MKQELKKGYLLDDRYVIEKRLANGGFGVTYIAIDLKRPLKPPCVVKQFFPKITPENEFYSQIKDRFEKEAKVLELLSEKSSHIPDLLTFVVVNDDYFIVQDYIEGDNLLDKVRMEGTYNEQKALRLFNEMLVILEYIHSNNVIHLDIKPENIIIRKSNSKPVLIDFGAVKNVITSDIDDFGNPVSSYITIGTRGYMPPEQEDGNIVFASDLYSLTMTILYVITAKLPTTLVNVNRTLIWDRISAPLSMQFKKILLKGAEPDVDKRYKSSRQMRSEIRSLIYINNGKRYFSTGKYDKAIDEYKKSINVKPDSYEAFNRRGLVYNAINEYDKAIKDFTKSIALNSSYSIGYYNRAVAYLNSNDIDNALSDFDSALNINPKLSNAYIYRAELFYNTGQYDSAITDYGSYVEMFGESPRVLYLRGKALYRLGKYQDALLDFNKGLSIDSKYWDIYYYRGLIYYKLQLYREAIMDFNYATNADDVIVDTYFYRGRAYYYMGQYESAINDLNEVLERDSDEYSAYLYLGKAYYMLKRFNKAIEQFDMFIDYDTETVDGYNWRGKTFYEMGHYEQASADFHNALDLDSNDSTAKKYIRKIRLNTRIGNMLRRN